MRWTVTRVSGPTGEPVMATDLKKHLRVEHSDEDTYIGNLGQAARELLEDNYNRTLVGTTWDYFTDEFPDGEDAIELPRPPLISVTSVKYTTTTSTTAQTLSATKYIVDTDTEPGRVALRDGAVWPTETLRDVNGVEVRYRAGYATTATGAVPEMAKHYIRLVAGHWYVQREAVALGGGIVPRHVPLAAQAIGARLDARRYM